jgi:hypothetical protein
MEDAERKGRIGELLRIRVLQADTLNTIGNRLEALGHTEPITERDILHILDSAAVAVSARPPRDGMVGSPISWRHWTTRPRARTSAGSSRIYGQISL